MENKALIFGASGQLGVEISRELKARGYVLATYDRAHVDITSPTAVEQAVSAFDPQIVLNTAAYNMVDVAENEPHAAFETNAMAVRNLALACRQCDAKLVHFSTDYVFDGKKGSPYVETDPVHPTGAYAVSKLAGEYYAQAYLDNSLVIRTSGVFGPGGLRTARGNFIELMLRLAKSGQPIRVVEDHVASPTYAPALAAKLADLLAIGASGVFHVGGGTPISWYDFAKMIFETAGLNPELRPTNEREYRTAAHRPKFSALSNQKMEAAGVAPMLPLKEAVGLYLAARDGQPKR